MARTIGIDLGTTQFTAATTFEPLWLRGPALDAPTGQTLGEAAIGDKGHWPPSAQAPITARRGSLALAVPPGWAGLLRSAEKRVMPDAVVGGR